MAESDQKLPIKMLNDRLLVRLSEDGERTSSGGILIAFALSLLADLPNGASAFERLDRLAQVMHLTNKARVDSEMVERGPEAAAATLADHLERISGATFEVKTGDGATGIAIGLAADFPNTPHGRRWEDPDNLQREEYLLQSHAKGVYLLGVADPAVEHAVWDLLHRIGYRQFFPGKNWEVVPEIRDLSIEVDVEEARLRNRFERERRGIGPRGCDDGGLRFRKLFQGLLAGGPTLGQLDEDTFVAPILHCLLQGGCSLTVTAVGAAQDRDAGSIT